MICEKCKEEFEDKELHESHNVPCYLYPGNRKGRKNQADKLGRHLLCKECHDEYEESLGNFLKIEAFKFSNYYFEEDDKNGNSIP